MARGRVGLSLLRKTITDKKICQGEFYFWYCHCQPLLSIDIRVCIGIYHGIVPEGFGLPEVEALEAPTSWTGRH